MKLKEIAKGVLRERGTRTLTGVRRKVRDALRSPLSETELLKILVDELGVGKGDRRVLQNGLHDLLGFVFQLVRRNDAVDEPDLARPLGANQIAGEKQLADIALAQLAPQKSHDEPGDETAFRFRITYFGAFGRDYKIAG